MVSVGWGQLDTLAWAQQRRVREWERELVFWVGMDYSDSGQVFLGVAQSWVWVGWLSGG